MLEYSPVLKEESYWYMTVDCFGCKTKLKQVRRYGHWRHMSFFILLLLIEEPSLVCLFHMMESIYFLALEMR